MKKNLLLLLLFGFILSKAQLSDEQKIKRIDSILQVYTNKNQFNGSVLIAKKGKTLLSKGYGFANFSYDIKNTPSTKFKLASVSKQFTAMAIMILQETGKLTTEDKLSKFISDYPNGDKITIHHLLTHTSGIPNVTSLPLFDSVMTRPHTLEQLIAYTKFKALEFEPGSKFSYSNSGYILLSFIIEKASGKPYGEFMKEKIFSPLGMKNSGLYNNDEVLKNFAVGYHQKENGEVEHAPYIDMSIPSGAGALYSSVEDLFIWDQALYSEKLIKKSSMEKFLTPFKDGYAYGFRIDTIAGRKWISHSGGIEGFNTIVNRFPEDELYITILKNIDNQSFFPANRICRSIMLNQKYELPVERKVATVDRKIYDLLVGDYELQPGFVISITLSEGKLFSQATNQNKLELFPESEYKYFIKVVDAVLEFNKDEKGKIISLTLHQGGMHMPGKKIK